MTADAAAVAIRPVRIEDAARICAIYNYHVTATVITFEEDPVPEAEMARRIRETTQPWLVAEDDGVLAGYANASAWKTRASYRHTVESSVYVDRCFQRRGHARRLYEALLGELRGRGVHAVVAGIALPNPASIALHQALGFIASGALPQVGRKFDRWVDVGYWTLVL
jgi:L-amino acid N-acyltransferase YncA